jgi:6-pyruvoyltetrahydropterin/6-carboxytetrahydropterin synthase
MFEVTVRTHFSAAHRLTNYDGNCARWHGHNWEVLATLAATDVNHLGLAVDFREVKQVLRELLSELDHSDLNQHPAFTGQNPSCELIARYLYRLLTVRFAGKGARVARVQVGETPDTSVIYYEN